MRQDEIKDSGLLELYAMGLLEGAEFDLVCDAVASDPVLADALAQIEETLLLLAEANAITPNPTIKPLLLGKIDYMERIRQGKVSERIPVLNPNSKVTEFTRWLEREDMQLKGELDLAHVCIISDEPDKMTAIVWLTSGAPPETHTSDHEKFLIVEGTCMITIGTAIHSLKAGDYLSIPLHVSHHVEVTSSIPCKFVLQRVKAISVL